MSPKYALIIANTDYSDAGLAKLSAPGRDAEELARVLKSPDICAFDDVNVLLNQPDAVVRDRIDAFFDQKKPDDLLIMYFSGHGVRDEQGSLYLAVQNTNRFRLRATAIKSDFIRESMDQSRSRRQVLILDCCNSGAFAQGTKAVAGGSAGIGPAFEGTGYGHVVLTASDSTQFAWEGDSVIGETQNSLFTHFLVKGLEGEADLDGDGQVTINELYDYAYEQTVKLTPRQTPSKWSYKEQGEIILRESIRPEDARAMPLPSALLDSLDNPLADIRLAAVQQLAKLLDGRNLGLARSARQTLEKTAAEDDSYRVRQAAAQILGSGEQVDRIPEKGAAAPPVSAEAVRPAQQDARSLASVPAVDASPVMSSASIQPMPVGPAPQGLAGASTTSVEQDRLKPSYLLTIVLQILTGLGVYYVGLCARRNPGRRWLYPAVNVALMYLILFVLISGSDPTYLWLIPLAALPGLIEAIISCHRARA